MESSAQHVNLNNAGKMASCVFVCMFVGGEHSITNFSPPHPSPHILFASSSSFTSIPTHLHRISIPSPPVPTKIASVPFHPDFYNSNGRIWTAAVTKTNINLAANELTNRIQFVSVRSQLTSFDSLETNFCCYSCTTKKSSRTTLSRESHTILLRPRESHIY